MSQLNFPETSLPERATLMVDGPDAREFLNRLLTADIEHLAVGQVRYSALLTPQGKILADFFVMAARMQSPLKSMPAQDGFFLDCAKSQSADLENRLKFYKLRAKVNISTITGSWISVSPVEETETFRGYRDPRCTDIGWRCFAGERTRPTPGYHSARIELGLADSDADLGSGVFFPHEANLDQLGAISFDKGCYVGQEVVSRMEHRGMARSRILPVQLDGAAPAKGSDIRAGRKPVGTLLSSEGSRALALLRLDRLAEATEPLLTEGVSVEVLKPRWVGYDVPNSTSIT